MVEVQHLYVVCCGMWVISWLAFEAMGVGLAGWAVTFPTDNTTLNDGYLGLVIDEGRSEVRKVS